MGNELISKDLTDFFNDHLDIEISSNNIDLIESGYLDSLSFVELLVHIEQKFSFEVSIEDIELDDFRSIASIAHFIQSRNSSRASKPAE